MIKVDNLSFSFPEKDLYNKISFTLEEGQHCAFIGTNGTGKSTLIEMMMDPDKHLFDGKIEKEESCRIGYVSQFSQLEQAQDSTVYDYIAEDFIRLQKEIDTICTEMETATEFEELLERYQEALDAFSAIGGEDFESIINKKLQLADLIKHKDLKVSQLSGGEFKLVQVIREMLNQPTLLIMDEPDVFLDFENLEALKNLINAHKGTLLTITHNRYLLNHCFNKILHLENLELQEFEGTYVEYNFWLLQTKVEIMELAVADNEEIERNAKLINRLRTIATNNPDSAKGRSLKARVKIQERLEKRRVKMPFVDIQSPAISLPIIEEADENETILRLDDYSVGYDEILLEHVDFEIKATDKVALIGANGTGKTTLLRELAKNDKSSITFATDTEMGYLSQQQGETLNEDNTIMKEFIDAGFETYDQVITYLEGYGFEEDKLYQTIKSLSGGEKNLLQLAKISASNANILLLDEPTSHLDTYAQIALEKAIQDYKGAVLMISHDYYTIINSMDYVLIIDDKDIRKMKLKKFKRKIYANHFDRDYLEKEDKKKALERRIETALLETDFETAKVLCEQLEALIKTLS